MMMSSKLPCGGAVRSARRRRLFPFAGALLALGSPLGLLVAKAAEEGLLWSSAFYARELQEHATTYAYLTISTGVVFVLLGWLLGRTEDELIDASFTDPMTGLANRRYFDARLAFELRRAQRYDFPVALVLVDVDRLKSINDQEGHEAGDRALCLVGRVLQATCRATDLAARSGGDEFAIIVPHATAADAAELGRRAIEALANAQPYVRGRKVTISVGVSDTRDSDRRDAAALVKLADQALYEAKGEGGGRARIHAHCRMALEPA